MQAKQSLQLYRKAGEVYESYLNGNIDQLHEWVGKSQMRLVIILEAIGARYEKRSLYDQAIEKVVAEIIDRNNY